MIHYPHFAFKNIFLINGYTEEITSEGSIFFYQDEEELENSIRLMLVNKKGSLSGWDLRFLRRGLKLSQAQIAEYLGKDAQTVARLEKSNEKIPKTIDLTIRTICAGHYSLQLKAYDLLRLINSSEENSDEKVYFSYSGKWVYNSLLTLKSKTYSDVSTTSIQFPEAAKRSARCSTGRFIRVRFNEEESLVRVLSENSGYTTIHRQFPLSNKRTLISEQYSIQ